MVVINKSFFNWYTQSLGGMIGIIMCMWSYLQGNMVVYGNILNNVDSVSFGGFLASYILVPLCIVVTILGAIESYNSNATLDSINKVLIVLTTIIGFLGTKLYFIIPSLLILFKLYSSYIVPNKKEILSEATGVDTTINNKECSTSKVRKVVLHKENKKVIEKDTNKNILDKTIEFNKVNTDKDIANNKNLKTRISMAKELLSKNADKNFICELTGLSIEQVEQIELIKQLEKENK